MKKYLIGAAVCLSFVCALGVTSRGGAGSYQIEVNDKNIIRLDTRVGTIDVFPIASQPAVIDSEREVKY